MTDPRTGKDWILGDKFAQVYPHFNGMQSLWDHFLKVRCERGAFPFGDGKYEDFEPIFMTLIKKGIHDGYSDEYTREFLPTCEDLTSKADAKAANGDKEAAIELYLRACCVYRLARFPYFTDGIKREAYTAQKKAYMKASALMECPFEDIEIPHTAGTDKDEGKIVPLYIRLPKGTSKQNPAPTVLLICGLDGHRPDNTERTNDYLKRGWATVIVDIPGTADSPAQRNDPTGSDRLFTSILDWMQTYGVFDMKKIIGHALSAGGYNGVRLAHTHASRLLGMVGQGAGMHHFFGREWLEKAQYHEYPWTALPALRGLYGFATQDEYWDQCQKKFSLLETGVIHKPATRLLLVNGTHDGLMPVEDSQLMFEYGTPKEGRFFTGRLHMGYPEADTAIFPWMESLFASVS